MPEQSFQRYLILQIDAHFSTKCIIEREEAGAKKIKIVDLRGRVS